MLTVEQQREFIIEQYNKFVNSEKIAVDLNRQWLSIFERKPAVYCFMQEGVVVYVGETSKLRKRMNNLFHTTQHVLRRNIGNKTFENVDGYTKATSQLNFPEHIEELVNNYITQKLKLVYIYTILGRKETEEYVIKEKRPKFNKESIV